MSAITSIRVAANDVDGKLVLEYTADKDQVAWQAKNGYVTADGLSSAPFYKEYKGVAIAEGRDDDWTVTKGEAFDAWQPAVFSVEVVANNCTYYAEMTNYMVIGVDVVNGTDGYTPVETPVVGQKLTANIKTTDGVIGSYPVNADATYFWHYKDCYTLLGTEPVYTVSSDNLGKVICCDVAVKGYAADAKWEAKGAVDYFTDIATSGYHDWIADAAEAGIIYGYPDHSYRPNNNVTRAQFITMLYRAAGSPEVKSTDLKFDDASAIDKNYLTAVAWGVENGVVLGYEDNTFRPDVKISRAQMATFMYRYLNDVAEYAFGDVTPCGFADADQVAAPYVDAVNAIVSAGVMNGMNAQTFAPNGTANRGMAATVMFRAYDLMAENLKIAKRQGSMSLVFFHVSCNERAEGEDAEIIPIYFVKPRYRQRILAASGLNGIARAVKILNEPVLVPGKARRIRRILHGVAGHDRECLGNRAGVCRLIIEKFPIYNFALRVIRQN